MFIKNSGAIGGGTFANSRLRDAGVRKRVEMKKDVGSTWGLFPRMAKNCSYVLYARALSSGAFSRGVDAVLGCCPIVVLPNGDVQVDG